MTQIKDFFLNLYIQIVNVWEMLPKKVRIIIYDLVAAILAIAIVKLEALQVSGGEVVAAIMAALIAFLTWFTSEHKETATSNLSE